MHILVVGYSVPEVLDVPGFQRVQGSRGSRVLKVSEVPGF